MINQLKIETGKGGLAYTIASLTETTSTFADDLSLGWLVHSGIWKFDQVGLLNLQHHVWQTYTSTEGCRGQSVKGFSCVAR